MARYIATSGSNFTPFTYDELVKPLERAAEMHAAQQDAYDAMAMETDALSQYITEHEDDSEAKALYDKYRNKLSALQQSLWENGVNAQSRRALSAARAGFANSINPLKQAIQNRQERSKEYWEMRHSHPDMIAAQDPGKMGLNGYLKDVNFGRDYYNYSGSQFASEVGVDAKARAGEIHRQLEYDKKSIPGYITRIEQQGFTSSEVNNATEAVRLAVATGNRNLAGLTEPEKILAQTLMSHLDSTGAYGKVSSDEFGRLIDYGREGLSQAIGGIERKYFSDKVWDNQQAWNMWKRQQEYKAAATTEKPKEEEKTYRVFSHSADASTPAGRDIMSVANKYFKTFDKPITAIDTNGNPVEIRNSFDARMILDSLGKEEIINAFGIDPDNPFGTFEVDTGNGEKVQMRIRHGRTSDNISSLYDNELRPGFASELPGSGARMVDYKDKSGNWVFDAEQTRELNKALLKYHRNVKEWREKNNNVDIQDISLNERDWDKIKKEYIKSDDVPREAYPYVLAVLSGQGNRTPAYLVDSDMPEDLREKFGNRLIDSYSLAHPDTKKGLEKTNDLVAYKIDKNGSRSKDGIRKYEEILDDGHGNMDPKKLRNVYANPEDVISNEIRFTTPGAEYSVNPRAFGTDVQSVYDELRRDFSISWVDTNGNRHHKTIDKDGIVHYLMKPLVDPSSAFSMTPAEEEQWRLAVNARLGQFGFALSPGTTPTHIVLNEGLQGELRSAVTSMINAHLGVARDIQNNDAFHIRTASGKPISYNSGSFNIAE